MFDDDTSYLRECAAEIESFGLQVFYPYDRCIMAVLKSSSDHIVIMCRKRKNIPFYQVFLWEFKPTNADYLKLIQEDKIFDYMFSNRDKVIHFDTGDLSGHETFREEVTKALKEKFR